MVPVVRLDDREQRIAYWAAGLGALSAVVFYAPGFDDFYQAWVLAIVGVAMGGLLALASRSRSRLLTCLAAVLLGFGPWGFAYVIGLPFLVLAGWLLWRGKQEQATRPRPPTRRKAQPR